MGSRFTLSLYVYRVNSVLYKKGASTNTKLKKFELKIDVHTQTVILRSILNLRSKDTCIPKLPTETRVVRR